MVADAFGLSKINFVKAVIKKVINFLGLSAPFDYALLKLRKKESSEDNIYKFYDGIINEGDLVFDIGTNIGNYTEIFLSLGAKVICLEPQDYCYKFLKLRFAGNKNVIIINKAVDDIKGNKEIFISEHHGVSSMSAEWINNVKMSGRFPDTKWNKKQKIETTTITELITKFGVPDYCKIDVEGYEYNVLKGLKQPLPLISFELSYENLSIALKCIEHLSSLGKIKLNLVIGHYNSFGFETWQEKDSFVQYLKSLNDNTVVADIFIKFAE